MFLAVFSVLSGTTEGQIITRPLSKRVLDFSKESWDRGVGGVGFGKGR